MAAQLLLLSENLLNSRINVDHSACFNFLISCITNSQYLKQKNNLSTTKRIIAINRQCFFIHSGYNKIPRFALFVFHHNRRTDLSIFLGNIFDVVRENQGFVSRSI